MPALNEGQRAPGPITLVATGCGTAIACVCALGLGEIERRLGGVWSVLAVVCAALLCAGLARVLGRLTEVVPSGAGLLAFLSRGLGRRWALLLMLPYVVLVLALVAVEARIVGAVASACDWLIRNTQPLKVPSGRTPEPVVLYERIL